MPNIVPYQGSSSGGARSALFGNDTPNGAVIFLATAWGAQFGGLNSFNHGLAVGCAELGRVPTVCVVPEANDGAINSAAKDRVILVQARLEEPAAIWSAVTAQVSATMCDHFFWVGHDVHTGEAAASCAESYGGTSVVIHHMDFESYATVRPPTTRAGSRRALQQTVLSTANRVMAVGPVLDASAGILSAKPSFELIPGLATVHPSQREAGPFRVVMAGRLELEDDGVKQARLAVEAVARASSDPRVRYLDWRMQLIGARLGPDQAIDDAMYRAIWDRHVSRHRPLIVEAFDPNRERLLNSLRDADLVIMPSLREGFGLVGWEAIAAGTPLVASTGSGLYKFLARIGQVGSVTPVDIHGLGAGRGEVDDADIARLMDAIVNVASNRKPMKRQALRLAGDLRADPARSWAGTAAAFMDTLKIPRRFGEMVRDMRLRRTAEPQLIVSTRGATLNVQPIGRDGELAKLARLWPSLSAGPAADRVGVVVGAPGLGKSTVLAAAAREILISDDPPSVAMFWSFADQAGEGGGSQARSLLDWLLASFGRLPNTPLSDAQRIDLAVELLKARRALLILDGLDAVQFPPGHPKEGNVSDTAVEALINQLGTTSPGLLLLGTRLSPKDLVGISESQTIRLKPLGLEAGAELLRERGLCDEQRTLEGYVKRLNGSPISLELFAGYVTERAAGELRAIDSFLDSAGDLPEVEDLLRATMEQCVDLR